MPRLSEILGGVLGKHPHKKRVYTQLFMKDLKMEQMTLKTYKPRNRAIPKLSITLEVFFDNPLLASVVTLPEACIMWQKSKSEVLRAIDRGFISARRSFSGGSYMLSVASLERHWGLAVVDVFGEIMETEQS